jgi:hypothetical protein
VHFAYKKAAPFWPWPPSARAAIKSLLAESSWCFSFGAKRCPDDSRVARSGWISERWAQVCRHEWLATKASRVARSYVYSRADGVCAQVSRHERARPQHGVVGEAAHAEGQHRGEGEFTFGAEHGLQVCGGDAAVVLAWAGPAREEDLPVSGVSGFPRRACSFAREVSGGANESGASLGASG